MPVMPAPTTSTSTSARRRVVRFAVRHRCWSALYRPVSIRDATTQSESERGISWRSSIRSRRAPGPLRDGAARPGPKERYYDPDFFALEAEQLWPRTWQMACRLEEIPRAGRLRRVRDPRPVGHRACAPTTARHAPSRTPAATGASRSSRAGAPARAGSPARSTAGATAPTARTPSVTRSAGRSPSTTSQPGDIDLRPVRCETWGGCAWINLDDDAPAAARLHRAVRHDPRRLEGRVAARRVVVRVSASR